MILEGKRWQCSGRIKTCRVHDLMRDLSIKKCKEVFFLNVHEYSEDVDLQSIVADCCSTRKRMHRCAIYVNEGAIKSHPFSQHGEKSPYIRSLLIFLRIRSVMTHEIDLTNALKCFPLLRVLDLQDTCILIRTMDFGHLIHLRYVCLRNFGIEKLPSHFWDLKYLVTLDFRSALTMQLSNKFHHMERLRHLYLPRIMWVKDGERLSFRARQMETLKNFDPSTCEIKDLFQMTSLRIFSMIPHYSFESLEDLKGLAEIPVIKSGHMVNSLRLRINADVIEKDPTILVSIFSSIPCLLTKLKLYSDDTNSELALHGVESVIERGIDVFPNSLQKLSISRCELSRKLILVLEKLPRLEQLILYNASMGKKISFSVGSFSHLKQLNLQGLQEWEVEDGGMSPSESAKLVYLSVS